MRAKFFIFLFLLFDIIPCHSQITIEECYRKAQANYPLIKQYGLIEKTKEYNLENAKRGYLPKVAFTAQATYQSDVTEIPFDAGQLGIPGLNIPAVDRDQYKMEIGIEQTIWDGGTTRSQKGIFHAEADIDRKETDVSIYTVNGRINQLFFGILLADAQLAQNKVLQTELQRNCDQVVSYINNGIANQSDLDALRVDLLKAKQAETQLVHTRKAYAGMLSQLIGEKVDDQTTLEKPDIQQMYGMQNNRPELALFDAKIHHLKAQDERIKARLMPRIGIFLTGGYGKPGLDMLENGFKAYYLAGVRLSWNISNFWTKRNDQQNVQSGIRSIETQRETFLFNTALDVATRNATIKRYQEQMKYDDEIIRLQESVRRASETKMANGTLSGTELTRDIHAEQLARQDKIIHEMELLMAIYDLKYVTGD